MRPETDDEKIQADAKAIVERLMAKKKEEDKRKELEKILPEAKAAARKAAAERARAEAEAAAERAVAKIAAEERAAEERAAADARNQRGRSSGASRTAVPYSSFGSWIGK